ncbi:MAG: hypothetical protein KAV82_08750 [Phycisphaerae bacterium]|nr:hypothetical protein [Phycisphaerae bacterium]
METLSRIMVYVGAIWPVVLLVPSRLSRFKRGQIRESRWVLAFGIYALWIALATVLHYVYLAQGHSAGHIHSHGVLGSRASLGFLTLTEKWLVLGLLLTVPVALRSVFKRGHWFGVPRWRSRF